MAQLGAKDATHASFVTISFTEDTPTELSMKRRREGDLAGAEAKRLGYNSDGFGTQGFPWPNGFSDAESMNGPPSDEDDDNDNAGDRPSPTPAQQAPAASMAAAVAAVWDVEPYFPP